MAGLNLPLHINNIIYMIWSRYTYLFSKENRFFIYNSLSNCLAEIDEVVFNLVKEGIKTQQVETKDIELSEQLCKMKVLVDNDDDEINKIKYINRLRRQNNRRLILTINPTLACNFNCPYCFESEHPNIYMTDEVEEQIVHYVESCKEAEVIDVTWFGGEPLLALERIKSLTSKLKKTGLKYSAKMITNGYLLTDNNIKEFENLSIKFLQITIDGMANLHNKRRCLKSGKPTFNTIIKNIDNIQSKYPQIGVSIRVNVDNSNENDFIQLYQFLSDKHYPNAKVSLAFVKNLSDCKTCANLCDRNRQAEFVKKVQEKYGIGGSFIYPLPDRTECAIRNNNAIVIGPQGEVYKCWNDVGDSSKVIGKIGGKVENEVLLLRYLVGADPFEDPNCLNCFLLPVCGGGCPLSRIQKKYDGKEINYCPLIKDNLYDFLLAHINEKEKLKSKTL